MVEENRDMVQVKVKKKRGAPLGNQNARKRGFYSEVLNEKERRYLKKAVNVEGLDAEIVMLRAKIVSIIENDPDNLNLDLTVRAVNALRKMLLTRTGIVRLDADAEARKEEEGGIKQAVLDVLEDVEFPAGSALRR